MLEGHDVIAIDDDCPGLGVVLETMPDVILLGLLHSRATPCIEALRALKEDADTRWIPVVVTTTCLAYTRQLLDYGATPVDWLLEMPFNIHDLLDALAMVTRSRQAQLAY